MTNDFAIVCVAFGERYVEQQTRLFKSVQEFHPEATTFFWTDILPINSKPHVVSPYGFKVHAIAHAKEVGFKKIIFFDPAVIVVDKLDEYFNIVKDYGVVAAEDDNLLHNYCDDKAYEFFGTSRKESEENKWHLCGGSIFCFDFDMSLCNEIFEKWKMAEQAGIFAVGRNDESAMSLSLYMSGSRATPYDLCRYNNVPNPLVRKIHFK